MTYDLILGGTASVIILIYLVYALARPEQF